MNEVLPVKETNEQEEALQGRLEEMVGEFDFAFLRLKFEEIMRRSGKKNEDVRMSPAEMVSNLHMRGALGYHDAGRIGINVQRVMEIAATPQEQSLLFQHLLIHEEIHSATRGDGKTGFAFNFMGESIHGAWNEGVTEKLAREITKEYYSAHGNAGSINALHEGYQIPRTFVDLIIKTISEKCGVSEATVWDAIVRAMFVEHDLDFSEDESILPADFWEKLGLASTEDLAQGLTAFETRSLRSFTGLPEEVPKEIKEDSGFLKLVKSIAEKLGFSPR